MFCNSVMSWVWFGGGYLSCEVSSSAWCMFMKCCEILWALFWREVMMGLMESRWFRDLSK